MALSERQPAEVNKRLSAFCEARVQPAVRDTQRIGFRMKGNEVVLFEERAGFQLDEVAADPTGIFWG